MDAVTIHKDRISPLAQVQIFSRQQNPQKKSTNETASAHSEFPDPRLFDYDQNGRVDANDVIQERSEREGLKIASTEQSKDGQKSQVSVIA